MFLSTRHISQPACTAECTASNSHTCAHTHSDLQVSKAHKCASVAVGLDQKINCGLQLFSPLFSHFLFHPFILFPFLILYTLSTHIRGNTHLWDGYLNFNKHLKLLSALMLQRYFEMNTEETRMKIKTNRKRQSSDTEETKAAVT